MKRIYRDELVKFTFVLPALLLFCLAILIPFAKGANIAFTNWNGISPTYEYVGLRNLKLLFSDTDLLQIMGNTLQYTVFYTLFCNVFGLLLAVMLVSKFKGENFIKSALFMPVIMSLVLTAYIFSYVYGTVFPSVLHISGLMGNEKTAMWGVILMASWKEVGLAMVIYYAGLQTIPKDVYESSTIDGASPARQFFSVTLPLLAPAFTYCIPLWIGNGLRMFDYVFAVGGPGRSTQTIAQYVYQYVFPFNKAGYGQMAGLVMFIFVMGATVILTSILRKREVEY
ncbi:carbohydrate ABC transporter permease [Paenibacillus sp. LPE1-1-1.1]|uniref:carbohydrate ABC transporter permease n=1 Tax=Paenibacillus sp. LPE1-1-1.1 TaxID=3135230 RepID=UPI00344228D1